MKVRRYLLTMAIALLLWQAAALAAGPQVLPAPWPVIKSLVHELAMEEFRLHSLTSAGRAMAGLFLGFLTAFPLGLLLGASPKVDAWISPFIFLTYPVPKILFLPVLLVLLGLGEWPKIILIALTCGYQILVVTRDSVRNLDPSYFTSFSTLLNPSLSYHARAWLSARHLLIPASLPSAISALRLATGTAVAVLFIAESFATDLGLGYMIMDAWGNLDLPRMFSGIIAMSVIGFIFYELTNLLEFLLCRWNGPRQN